MSQCVPNWVLDDDHPSPPKFYSMRSHSNPSHHLSKSNYEVAELTWENGQLSLHGLGLPRVPCKPITTAATTTTTTATDTTITGTTSSCPTKYAWEKPRGNGTLESIVNQATRLPHHGKPTLEDDCTTEDKLVPWILPPKTASAAATMTVDALVPCSNRAADDRSFNTSDHPIQHDLVGCSTHVESCSEGTAHDEDYVLMASKRAKVARVPGTPQEWSSRDQSVSTSGTFGMNKNQRMSMNTYERELGSLAFTSTSNGSPENTNSGKQCTKANTSDEHDSVCHSRPQEKEEKEKNKGKSSVSTKRSRAAAIHNQSERKRRDKINQRMKTLQKLVPNSSKTDKASMLDEVIEYLKQLQGQVQMMNRMNMPAAMMMPMTMQQQFQMQSMMASMGMGLGLVGMGMGITGTCVDVNNIGRPNPNTIPAAIPPLLHPNLFMPMPTWDASTATADHHRLQTPLVPADPLSTFLACQQPMTMDQYSRMAAMYQHLQQPHAMTNPKS